MEDVDAEEFHNMEQKITQKFTNMQENTMFSIKEMLQKEITDMKQTLKDEEKAHLEKLVRNSIASKHVYNNLL